MFTINNISFAIVSCMVYATYLVLQSSHESFLGHVLNSQNKMFKIRSTQHEIRLFKMKTNVSGFTSPSVVIIFGTFHRFSTGSIRHK